jgi:hypothetical protein
MTLQDQLEPGESLLPGQSKISNGNVTRLDFKPDGNLVLTNMQTRQPTWSSNSGGLGGTQLVMNGNGQLSVQTQNGTSVWSVGPTNSKKAHLVVQDDGNLVIYKDNKTDAKYAVWSSNTSGGQQSAIPTAPIGIQSPMAPQPPIGVFPTVQQGQPNQFPHYPHRHPHQYPQPPFGQPQGGPHRNPYFQGEGVEPTKKASLGVGAVAGTIAVVAGAPLWGTILAASAGVVAAPKIIDFAAKLFKKL